MIPMVNVGYASTNYYVLGSNTTRLLIDVGWPGTLPKPMATLRRAAIPLQNIGYLLVTHYHRDHAGLTQQLRAQGVRLLVLEPQLLPAAQELYETRQDHSRLRLNGSGVEPVELERHRVIEATARARLHVARPSEASTTESA
jgi:glyoxylase-like metal-dependent hydrolase (beta-lactamase superfamily II)